MNIPGIKLKKLKIINNPKGNIYKYISKKDSIFKKFGKVYFSEIFKGKIKGWNLHKNNTCIICVPSGKVKFVLSSNRKKYFFKEKKMKVILSKKKHIALIIPPNIWFSFTSITKTSLVANFLNNPHSKKEVLKKPTKSKF